MYMSHDKRRIDFRGLTGSQRTPRDLRRHIRIEKGVRSMDFI